MTRSLNELERTLAAVARGFADDLLKVILHGRVGDLSARSLEDAVRALPLPELRLRLPEPPPPGRPRGALEGKARVRSKPAPPTRRRLDEDPLPEGAGAITDPALLLGALDLGAQPEPPQPPSEASPDGRGGALLQAAPPDKRRPAPREGERILVTPGGSVVVRRGRKSTG